jgi:hypothetical protein
LEMQGTYMPTLERQAEELESHVRTVLAHHAPLIEAAHRQEYLARLPDEDPSSRPT